MKKNSIGQTTTGKRVAGSIGKYFIMLVVLFISVYPILWVFLSSFKKDPGGLSLPTQWVFDGYITIFTKLNIQTYFLNSFIVTIISTFISVLIVSMSAYISARMQFKGKGLVTLMFTTTLFIPSISISFPIYRLLGDLGLKDTRTGLILIYSGLGIAITFFILRSYFQTIPKEMEEAAMMDGCGYTKTFFRIIVPIAKPGLATAAIMAFLNNWNEFYFASILIKSKDKMTIPALLGQFTTAYSKNLNGMFSAIIVAVVPTIIIFCMLSEVFVKSLTAGAVKG
ncbi:MAG: carbohydrate ABC transporter permease [Lachnospiraceae bacterium]|nr:carbohydrate ABC transporter permease [Lachnospiraceae bacterium]